MKFRKYVKNISGMLVFRHPNFFFELLSRSGIPPIKNLNRKNCNSSILENLIGFLGKKGDLNRNEPPWRFLGALQMHFRKSISFCIIPSSGPKTQNRKIDKFSKYFQKRIESIRLYPDRNQLAKTKQRFSNKELKMKILWLMDYFKSN